MKPPMIYFGGKTTLAPRIAALLPGHKHYVEPFAGSLAVLLAKSPSAMETVNDLDGDLVHFWKTLRDQPADLERVCALTPHSRAEYTASHDLDGVEGLERARRVWVQLTQGRAGVRRATNGWRHYVAAGAGNASMPDYLDGYVARLAPVAERLKAVSLECRSALELIASYGADSDVLLFVDPPYLGSTRQSGGYVHEMKAEADHRELSEALHGCAAAVVLCGYHSDLYDGLYADWDRMSFAASTGQGGTWANRTEVLWSNRPLGNQPTLFDLTEVAA